jgi:hypothetical protein
VGSVVDRVAVRLVLYVFQYSLSVGNHRFYVHSLDTVLNNKIVTFTY